ncbi:MarR family winged helix-turn-helix transcriptional regulator [Streptomyces thermoalcalitolerans]|uniref:MarR family winged helix-turn-helix transcriptional regulator n=1 Tax=Streptomyces thermoalcalitolerans TaxID=65605 RepID=UPI003CD052A5
MHEDADRDGRGVAPGASPRSAAPRRTGPSGADPQGTDPSGADPSGTDREFLSLERELTVLLRRARANQSEMAREVHPDLESAAYGLLVRLEEGSRRATDLAAYIGVGKATMSRQLRALEELGLVTRTPDPADGRAWLVTLTDEGRRRVGRVREARRARYVSQLAHWDRREVAELARLLHQLNRVMEK